MAQGYPQPQASYHDPVSGREVRTEVGWGYDRNKGWTPPPERYGPELRVLLAEVEVAVAGKAAQPDRAMIAVMTTLPAVQKFIDSALNQRSSKQPPLVLQSVSLQTAIALETLGAKPRARSVSLDHDHVLHIHDGHGLEKERLRGQVPITAEDLLNVGALLETATNMEPGTPSHSKNGAMRIAVETEDQDYRYSIVFEVRKHHVVPFTMYKRKK